MGMILSSRRENDNMIVEAVLDPQELVQLRGEIDEIHLISEKVADVQTNISKRGKNEATKYFLIPRELRKDLNIMEPVSCQRINTPDKVLFVYVVQKNIFQGVQRLEKKRYEKHNYLNHKCLKFNMPNPEFNVHNSVGSNRIESLNKVEVER